jgi:peptidoglycan-associated lipoprotein
MLRAVRVLWLTPLALAACAHQQTSEAPPPPPVVAQAAPPVAEAPDQNKADDTAELKRILSGPIAHFEFDQAQLTGESRQKLQALATAMKAHPAARVRIAGNCDELGTTEYNLALGQRRAEVARKYLVDLGVATSRVETISYGEERPVAQGHDAESHAQNRRDDAELLSTR